ncbi:fluoride efflux transporter FluC [Nesterenkonia sandarakina]|uniref:Fluoride-specific ion channel FluC n=1 Tax=Nesterenkonia sandarakina TaxID=272918 RepID=A0A2T0YHS4_9MICC|nr:CrcB family protein [Nesterenkonia sandarakina]PRZ14551.1 camphor resistance protein CrcB [Nesterenkonia sandarakina]
MDPEISMIVVLGVALGGALGAVLRFLLDRYLRAGILLANVLGCLVLGYLFGELTWLAETGADAGSGVFAALFSGTGSTILSIGVLGALSTFATVSVRVAQTWMAGRQLRAAGIWVTHVGLGFAAAALGIALSRMSGLY